MQLFAICNGEQSAAQLTRVRARMPCQPSPHLLADPLQPGLLLDSWCLWQPKPELSSCSQRGEFRSCCPIRNDLSEAHNLPGPSHGPAQPCQQPGHEDGMCVRNQRAPTLTTAQIPTRFTAQDPSSTCVGIGRRKNRVRCVSPHLPVVVRPVK